MRMRDRGRGLSWIIDQDFHIDIGLGMDKEDVDDLPQGTATVIW